MNNELQIVFNINFGELSLNLEKEQIKTEDRFYGTVEYKNLKTGDIFSLESDTSVENSLKNYLSVFSSFKIKKNDLEEIKSRNSINILENLFGEKKLWTAKKEIAKQDLLLMGVISKYNVHSKDEILEKGEISLIPFKEVFDWVNTFANLANKFSNGCDFKVTIGNEDLDILDYNARFLKVSADTTSRIFELLLLAVKEPKNQAIGYNSLMVTQKVK